MTKNNIRKKTSYKNHKSNLKPKSYKLQLLKIKNEEKLSERNNIKYIALDKVNKAILYFITTIIYMFIFYVFSMFLFILFEFLSNRNEYSTVFERLSKAYIYVIYQSDLPKLIKDVIYALLIILIGISIIYIIYIAIKKVYKVIKKVKY